MAIELEKAIELFNEILKRNQDYNNLDKGIQSFVRYRAIHFIFIGRSDRYNPKAIAGYLVRYSDKFEPTIPDDLLSLNFNLGRDVGGHMYAVQSIEQEFDEIIANASPKPQPIYEPPKPRVRPSEESFNERAKKNIKSGEKPLPGTQPDSPKEDWSGDWS